MDETPATLLDGELQNLTICAGGQPKAGGVQVHSPVVAGVQVDIGLSQVGTVVNAIWS